MFVDIYSLGRGAVSSTEQFCCFTINHLQVLRGYRYEKVPEAVRAVACGHPQLAGWKKGDPDPKLEIVFHHEAPVVYPKLPERWRVPQIQAAGTARELVPVTNPLERALYPPGVDAYTLDMLVAPAPPTPIDLADLLPGLVDRVRTPALTGGPPVVDVQTEDEIATSGPELSERPRGVRGEGSRPVAPPATVAEVVVAAEAASGRCQGKRGDGSTCPRRARPGSSFCGAHGAKVVAT